MHTAVFVEIGMYIVKEDWHANSEGREQKWEGGTENKRERKGEGDGEREKGRVMEIVVDSVAINGFNYSRTQPTFQLTPSFCL